MEGKYTDAYLAHLGADAPKFTDADMRAIGSPLDFVGLNVYTARLRPRRRLRRTATPWSRSPASYPHMARPGSTSAPKPSTGRPSSSPKLWNVKEIYITENGASSDDVLTPDGHVYDTDRTMYPAQLPHPTPPRRLRRRPRQRLLLLEPARQLRVGRRLRQPLRHRSTSTSKPRSAPPNSAPNSTKPPSPKTPSPRPFRRVPSAAKQKSLSEQEEIREQHGSRVVRKHAEQIHARSSARQRVDDHVSAFRRIQTSFLL